MLNAQIFSLRFSTHVFVNFLKVSLVWIVLLSLFRFNYYFLSVYHAYPHASIIELIHSFWAGLRFDILIWGFISIPVYVLLMLMSLMMWWPSALWVLLKGYLYLVWIIICAVTFFDFFYFTKHGAHLRLLQYQEWDWSVASQWITEFDLTRRWMFIVVWALISVIGLLALRYMPRSNWKDWASPRKPQVLEKTWRILVPALLIALAARGTVTAHHLRYEDSQVSFTSAINEMALNALWCLDK